MTSLSNKVWWQSHSASVGLTLDWPRASFSCLSLETTLTLLCSETPKPLGETLGGAILCFVRGNEAEKHENTK